MALITCRGCSSAISSMAKSCPKCGHVLEDPQIPSFKCDECGKAIALEHDGPCPECGNPQPFAEVVLIDPSSQDHTRPGIALERIHKVQAAVVNHNPLKIEDSGESQETEITERENLKKAKEELRKTIVLNGFEVGHHVRLCPSCGHFDEVGSKRTLFGRISNGLDSLRMWAWILFAASCAGCLFTGPDPFGLVAAGALCFALLASTADDIVNFITPIEKYFCTKCGHRGFNFKRK